MVSMSTCTQEFHRQLDTITLDSLQNSPSLKWSAHPGALGMFVAEMDFGVCPTVAALLERITHECGIGYLCGGTRQRCLDATAAWVGRRFGWEVSPESVRLYPDVLTCLHAVLRAAPEGAVIVPTPAYMPFLSLPPLAGRRVIEVPSPVVDGRYVLDLPGIERAFDDGGRIFILCNPWNPTGRAMDRDELEALCDVVESRGGIVFSDEIHSSLVLDGHTHTPYASISEAAWNHTITATAASKGWNIPGIKSAQMIASAPMLEMVDAVAPLLTGPTSTVGVRAATECFNLGEEWNAQVRSYLTESMELVADRIAQIPGVSCTRNEATYIAWLDFSELGVEDPAASLLEEEQVALTPGGNCGEGYSQHARMICATPQPILTEALDRIERWARRHAPEVR